MIFDQHWYTWLFFIPAISCFIKAGNNAMRNQATKMTWYMIMTVVWSSLIYYNWQS